MTGDRRQRDLEVKEAARIAVKDVFAILGVDIDHPESVSEFQADLRFNKKLRRASDHGYLAIVTMVVGGVGWLIVHGLISIFKRPVP